MSQTVERPLVGDLRSAIGAAFTRPVYLIRLDFPQGTQFLSTEAALTTSNFMVHSEALDKSPWASNLTTVTKNASIAPDGTLTADALTATAVAGVHYHEQALGAVGTIPDATLISGGIYLKKGGWARVALQLIAKNNSGPSMTYDFDTKTVTATAQGTGQSGVTFEAEDIGDGWARLIIKGASTLTGATIPRLRVSLRDGAGTESFTGDVLKPTYAWGAQLVVGTSLAIYARTDAGMRGIENYIEGQIVVTGFSWSPDGSQEGNIELLNENNSAVALVLGNGIADTPVTIWKTYRKLDNTYAAPSLIVRGVLDASTISETSVILSVVTAAAEAEYQPNRYFTKKEGFNFLPAHGLVVTWNGEIFVLESE